MQYTNFMPNLRSNFDVYSCAMIKLDWFWQTRNGKRGISENSRKRNEGKNGPGNN
jgi:hypothetical protein